MATPLGVLTLGQTPRPDGLARDIQAVLGPGLRVIERGALDGASAADVARLAPASDDDVLITLLKDGSPVQVGKRALLDRLQAAIEQLEAVDDVGATLLMCTGDFPPLRHQKPLVQPHAALYGAVIGLAGGARIGALAPLPAQVAHARDKWRAMGVTDPVVIPADPYGGDPRAAVAEAAREAAAAGAGLLFLDCFGYDLAMRDAARAAFGGFVILARSLAARLVGELVA